MKSTAAAMAGHKRRSVLSRDVIFVVVVVVVSFVVCSKRIYIDTYIISLYMLQHNPI
jgi:hypothetical protein